MEHKPVRKRRWAVAASVISLTLVLLLVVLQALVMPKYIGEIPEGRLIGEYYNAPSRHNVLFVGDCEVYESFSTVTLWEEYGISAYIRGSAQQLIWQSYYLLAEAIARGEQPEAVVFNVLSMKYETPQHEEYNRMTLDDMAWSEYKLGAIRASMTEEESLITYLFPFLRYHSRISSLKKEDFTSLFTERETISYNGYLMQTGVVPEGERGEPASPYPDALISDLCFDYLERMRALCEENGITFVLIKAPTNNWKYYWYDEWDAQISVYAASHNLPYYNFIGLDDEIGIDWSTDTYDAGVHLNVYGAEKLSSYFGEILKNEIGVSDLSDDETLSAYYAELSRRYATEKQKGSST